MRFGLVKFSLAYFGSKLSVFFFFPRCDGEGMEV